MTFCLVCSSHLRSRLTDQGESYHFGGYADIRVLLALRSFNEGWGNAFLLFTAAWVLTVSARALK
jgi:hypothetical protein